MTGQERATEEQLEHWRSELARALKANPALPWPNLIDWAEEAEHFASKACTKPGRARLAGLDTRVTELEADVARLTRELEQARQAKLSEAEPRLAAMERLSAAWQKEAERARKDLASQAYPDDSIEFVAWSALDRPLEEVDVVAILKTIRHCRFLAAEALHALADSWKDVEKRIRALHYQDGDHCAVCTEDFGRLNAPWPCATIRALENKEPTA